MACLSYQEEAIEFQVLGADGRILGQEYTTIEADCREWRASAVDIEFAPPATREHGRIVTSTRDGGKNGLGVSHPG